MKREEKVEAVQELKERFQKASSLFLADYQGLAVSQVTQIRQELRKNESEMKVIKNTLASLAVKGTDLEPLAAHFVGVTAVIASWKDPVSPAKILVKFAKDMEKLKIRAGFLAGKVLSAAEVDALSKLPSREEMLAKLLGSMMAPAQNLYNVISAIPRKLVTVLAAIRDKKA
jgi:large subunit ribosomal protein L10